MRLYCKSESDQIGPPNPKFTVLGTVNLANPWYLMLYLTKSQNGHLTDGQTDGLFAYGFYF